METRPRRLAGKSSMSRRRLYALLVVVALGALAVGLFLVVERGARGRPARATRAAEERAPAELASEARAPVPARAPEPAAYEQNRSSAPVGPGIGELALEVHVSDEAYGKPIDGAKV